MQLVTSPSSRRAWIEISRRAAVRSYPHVALLAEGVDRNDEVNVLMATHNKVALLAEGVDRNAVLSNGRGVVIVVALLAEGVDRNTEPVLGTWPSNQSPSSRRAWIEIPSP